MNSMKTVVIVVVLAAVAYVAYVKISGRWAAAPPPGAPSGVADVKVDLPEMGPGHRMSTGPTANLPSGGMAPPFMPGKMPSASIPAASPQATPSVPPAVAQAAIPPHPSSPDTVPAAVAPPPTRQAARPDDEIGEAFTRFIGEAHSQLDAAFAERDQDWLASLLGQLTQRYKDPRLTRVESRRLTELLDQVAGTLIYSRQHLLEGPYRVREGDTLEQIARQYNVPAELLAKINGIHGPQGLQPGQEIKVVRGPFDAEVDLDDHELTLRLQDRYYAGRFPIAAGQDEQRLVGEHTVLRKNAPAGGPQGGVSLELSEQVTVEAAEQAVPGSPAGGAPAALRLGARDLQDVYDILSVGSRIRIRR